MLGFPAGYFDAVYSYMLINMRLSLDELHFIFSEIRRVLKPKGFNFFSVRIQNDISYGNGVQIDTGIYDINSFQIRFFTEQEIQDLMEGFEILDCRRI
jgi:SAM-dependent methyltransferase